MLKNQVDRMEKMAALMAAKTAGILTPEQEQELADLMQDEVRYADLLKMLENKDFVDQELQALRDIDSSKALTDMQQRIAADQTQQQTAADQTQQQTAADQTQQIAIRHRMRSMMMRAAAVVILFMAGGAFWYYRDYKRVTPPEITDRVKSAMLLCQENGRNEAEIISPLQTTADRQPVLNHAEKALYHVDDDFAEQLEKASRVTTYQDKEYWVKLDDGSLVHLNYDTHLIYPEKFGDRRDVILDGEAYFMVAKDKSRAFLVHTSQGDVRVIGTEFYINTRKEQQEQTSVVLVKGSVSFATTDGKETMMKPGQQLTVTQGQIQQKEVDVSPYQAWNEGEFVFADEPLENLLMTMARWYHLEIEYANEDARQMRFTGTIDRYGSAEVILHSISKVTGLVIEQNGSHVVIR